MQPMQFPRILAFIEGTMEQMFVNRNFHYVTVVPVSNGTSWSTAQMCDQIVTFYKARNVNFDKIIIWIDRERRQESHLDIERSIEQSLHAEGANPDKIAILICDRMTENMILADCEMISAEFGIDNYSYCGDGVGGKYVLRSMYKSISQTYRETRHGVAL